jgi:4-hydroxyphenylpyruvate dioxygenase
MSGVQASIRDLGMHCSLFQPFRDFEGMPFEQRSRAFERMDRKFDVMAELDVDLILLCSNCSPLASDDRRPMSSSDKRHSPNDVAVGLSDFSPKYSSD